MNLLLLLALSTTTPHVALPPEVQAFVIDRDACDHFRGEPTEGDSPEQVERRAFVTQSVEIHCAGTDRRLAALKKRYSDDRMVMPVLGRYESAVEGRCDPESSFKPKPSRGQA